MDVKFGENALGVDGADAEEGLEGFLGGGKTEHGEDGGEGREVDAGPRRGRLGNGDGIYSK